MKFPFPVRRVVHKAAYRQMESTLADIRERLDRLEQRLEQIAETSQQPSSVTVNTMNVDHPVIQNLTFRMDKLEIDELSGALNFGNNFGEWKQRGTSKPDPPPKKAPPAEMGRKQEASRQKENELQSNGITVRIGSMKKRVEGDRP